MNFNWNIDTWANNETPAEKRFDPLLSVQKVILKPVKYLYALFLPYRAEMLKKLRYNSQQIVLENLLNDMFDNTLRRIRVYTTYDVIKPPYVYNKAENQPLYVHNQTEYDADATLPVYYAYNVPELGILYDFVVECAAGSLTANQEVRLKAVVNYYRLASKRPLFIYDDQTTF